MATGAETNDVSVDDSESWAILAAELLDTETSPKTDPSQRRSSQGHPKSGTDDDASENTEYSCYWDGVENKLLDSPKSSKKKSKPRTNDNSFEDATYWDSVVNDLLELDIPVLKPEEVESEQEETEMSSDTEHPGDLRLDKTYIVQDSDSEEVLVTESDTAGPEQTDSDNTATFDDLMRTPSLNEALETLKFFSDSPDELPPEYLEERASLNKMMTCGEMENLDTFIKNHEDDIGAICLVSDDTGTTPVTAAASLGSLESLQKLCEAGVWLFSTDRDGYMAIHRAIENGHADIVEWLAEKGQWTAMTNQGLSPLHLAAKCGQFQITNILLNHILNLDEVTANDGLTPLHMAVQHGHSDIAELLIGKGADVNHMDSKGRSTLHIAAESGQAGLVDLLLMYSSDVNSTIPNTLVTPLHLAVENSHDQVVCKLLECGASVDQLDSTSESALHKVAGSILPVDCITQLCKKSEDIEKRNQKGRTALFLAVERGNVEATRAFVTNGANANVQIATGCTPLYAATHHGHWDIIEKLLEAGADINKQTDNGSTALYKAARNGQFHVVVLLLCAGAKTDIARKTGWRPLHVAVHHNHKTVVEQLLSAGADTNAADLQGQTPLAIAAYCKNRTLVKMIMKKSGDAFALYCLAKLGNREVMKFLKQCAVDFCVTGDVSGWQPIHYAAREGHYHAMSALCFIKVDTNIADYEGNTPLHLAVQNNHSQIVELLLRNHCYTNTENNNGEHCLSLAVRNGFYTITQLLIRYGVVLDNPDGDGITALEHAIIGQHKSVALLLITQGASIMSVSGGFEHNPICLVCKHGNGELFRMLLSKGARIYYQDLLENTLLHVAAQNGHLDIVLELIMMERSLINMENVIGKKPLHLAAAEGQALIVESLLSAGTKITIMEEDDTVQYEMAKHQAVWDILSDWAKQHPSMLHPKRPKRRSNAASNATVIL